MCANMQPASWNASVAWLNRKRKQLSSLPLPRTPAERIKKLLAKADKLPASWLQAIRGLEALESMEDKPAREALRRLVEEAGDPRVREEAARILKRLELRR